MLATAALALGLSPDQAAQAAAVAGQLDIRADCGAVGNGTADDSLPLKRCLVLLQKSLAGGAPTVLRLPAGFYRITGANGPMPTIEGHGGVIQGDGPHATYLILDPSYSGDLFSWSEAWIGSNVGPPSYNPMRDASGPTVTGLQITGSTDSPHRQTAFSFYDRNDHVLMRDIEVKYLNGGCISVGRTLRQGQAYVRESAFYNVMCSYTGAPDTPAVDIGSTSAPSSDATNELDFYKLAIFGARGVGLQIGDRNRYSATRRIRIFGLRIESIGADALVVGAPGDAGQTADIDVYDLTVVNAARAAIHIGGSSSAPPPYQIGVTGGALGPGNRTAIQVDSGQFINLTLGRVAGPVVVAPRAGPAVRLNSKTISSAAKEPG